MNDKTVFHYYLAYLGAIFLFFAFASALMIVAESFDCGWWPWEVVEHKGAAFYCGTAGQFDLECEGY